MTAVPLAAAVRSDPLYLSVAERIVQLIQNDHAVPGDRLPSERALSTRLQVSRVTLRSALARLESEGWVSSAPARGWFVRGLQAPAARGGTEVLGFTDAALAAGLSVQSRVLLAQRRPTTLDEAEQLGVVAGSELFELRRLRLIDEVVIAFDNSRIVCALAPGIERRDFGVVSLYGALRTGPPPLVPSTAEYSVEATLAGPDEAALLQMTSDIPLLVAHQRTFDQQGRAFELGRTVYRSDRYRFKATIGLRPAPDSTGP